MPYVIIKVVKKYNKYAPGTHKRVEMDVRTSRLATVVNNAEIPEGYVVHSLHAGNHRKLQPSDPRSLAELGVPMSWIETTAFRSSRLEYNNDDYVFVRVVEAS